jgi:glycosyltransferase involved in cell wall biosynthesis
MKISFIIPAFNEERLIGRCLESTMAQDELHDFEVIVVDNGSTDATRSVVEAYPSARAIYYADKRGPAAARNEGARHANGELLVFFDADVVVPPDWTRKALRLFEDERLMGVSGPYMYMEFNKLQRMSETVFYWLLMFPLSKMLAGLKVGNVALGGNLAVRKQAFDAIGGFDATLEFYGDEANLVRRLIRIGRVDFSRRLWVKSSARRFLKEGLLRTEWLYVKNFFSQLLFHRVATKNHTNVRD